MVISYKIKKKDGKNDSIEKTDKNGKKTYIPINLDNRDYKDYIKYKES